MKDGLAALLFTTLIGNPLEVFWGHISMGMPALPETIVAHTHKIGNQLEYRRFQLVIGRQLVE